MDKDQVISDLVDALKVIRWELIDCDSLASAIDTAARVADNALAKLNQTYEEHAA